MARYAGINHDVALFLATADQWADESLLTSPLEIPTPISKEPWKFPQQVVEFLRKQRFVHFACALRSDGDFTKLNFTDLFNEANDLVCQVGANGNDPFASELLMMGIKRQDLLIAGAGLHTIQDSYAHAGFPNTFGHASVGHWPDRPWTRPDRYQNMIRTFFKALVAIRTLLPENALDKQISGNWAAGWIWLANSYLERKDVQAAISFNPLRDDISENGYGELAFNAVIKSAVARGLLNPEAFPAGAKEPQYVRKNLAEIAKSRMNACDNLPNRMVEIWVDDALELKKKGGVDLINEKLVFQLLFPGRPINKDGNLPKEVIEAEGGLRGIVHQAVLFLTANRIPLVTTGAQDEQCGSHPTEVESEATHAIEMQVRVDHMKNFVRNITGVNLEFNKKSFKDRMSPKDQAHWDEFFTDLIINGARKFLNKTEQSIAQKEIKTFELNHTILSKSYFVVSPMVHWFLDKEIQETDLEKPRFQADSDVLYYQFVDAFNDLLVKEEAAKRQECKLAIIQCSQMLQKCVGMRSSCLAEENKQCSALRAEKCNLDIRLANPERIKQIIQTNAKAGYSEDTLKTQPATLR